MADVFCKKTLNKIMPAAKAILAGRLEKRALGQKEIAEMLEVTQPAVSQYHKGIRGGMSEKMSKNKELTAYFDALTDRLTGENISVNAKTCEICAVTRKSGVLDKKEMTPFICILELAK